MLAGLLIFEALLGNWQGVFALIVGGLVFVWLGTATAWITLMIQRRRFKLTELFAFVAYCALGCLLMVLVVHIIG